MFLVAACITADANSSEQEAYNCTEITAELCLDQAQNVSDACRDECSALMLQKCSDSCTKGTCRPVYGSIQYACDYYIYLELLFACLQRCDKSSVCNYASGAFQCLPCQQGYIADLRYSQCVIVSSLFGCRKLIVLKEAARQPDYYCRYAAESYEYAAAICENGTVHSDDFLYCVSRSSKEGCLVLIALQPTKFCSQVSRGVYAASDCQTGEQQASGGLSCKFVTQLMKCQRACRNPLSYCAYRSAIGEPSAYECTPCYSGYISFGDRTTCLPQNSSSGCAALCLNGICRSFIGEDEKEPQMSYKCDYCARTEVVFDSRCTFQFAASLCLAQLAQEVDSICAPVASGAPGPDQPFQRVKCEAPLIADKNYAVCQEKIDYCRAECYATAVYCKVSAESARGYVCTQCPFGYRNSEDRTFCYISEDKDPDRERDLLLTIIILCVFMGVAFIIVAIFCAIKCAQFKERQRIVYELIRQHRARPQGGEAQQREKYREQLTYEYLAQLRRLQEQNTFE